MEPHTVTIVDTGKSSDLYIFVKVGYYPLLPLACASILIHTVDCVLYLIRHCHCHLNYLTSLELNLNLKNYFLNFIFIFLYDIKVTNVQ